MTNLTKIEFLCEDKKVGDALRNLLGVSIGQPKATPVINAEISNGKVTAKTDGKLIEQFAHHLQHLRADTLRPADVKAWLKGLGMSPGSYTYVVGLAKDMKLIRAVGKSSAVVYHIIRALPKPAK